MLSFVFCTLLVVSSVCSYPHFGPNYPRFFDEERPLDQPTVNVYKIYAPRLFYMPGYKGQHENDDSFMSRSKQMHPNSESIIDGMMNVEMFPDSLFDDGPNSIYQYDNEYVPAPSNIVSRKMPVYAPHQVPPMMPDYEPPMHLEEFHPAMGNNPHEFMNDGPQMMPDYFDMHGEHCDHHGMIHHNFNGNRNDDYPDYPTVQFLDPIFMNDFPHPTPYAASEPSLQVSPLAAAFPIFAPINEGPLTTFFKNFVSGSVNEDNADAQMLATMSFGEPEIVNIEEPSRDFISSHANEENANNEITIIVAETIESPDNEDSTVEEIERNFVKTILPDNTFVTREVDGNDPETSSSSEEDFDFPVEEVEVNIVKTILPDDSYLLSEAGGDNEKLQDEVISMIQNSEVAIPEVSEGGGVYVSRRLETPKM